MTFERMQNSYCGIHIVLLKEGLQICSSPFPVHIWGCQSHLFLLPYMISCFKVAFYWTSTVFDTNQARRKWQERRLSQRIYAFPTILFAKIFRLFSIRQMPKKMEGAKAFLQVSPRRTVEEWIPVTKSLQVKCHKERGGEQRPR